MEPALKALVLRLQRWQTINRICFSGHYTGCCSFQSPGSWHRVWQESHPTGRKHRGCPASPGLEKGRGTDWGWEGFGGVGPEPASSWLGTRWHAFRCSVPGRNPLPSKAQPAFAAVTHVVGMFNATTVFSRSGEALMGVSQWGCEFPPPRASPRLPAHPPQHFSFSFKVDAWPPLPSLLPSFLFF